jgi:hypothetical protein
MVRHLKGEKKKMKLDFVKSSVRIGVGISAAVVLALVAAPSRAQADTRDKLTIVTFSEPTQVTDTLLEPGTYVFKLPGDDRHIMQIWNRNENHLINTVIAMPNYRPWRTDKTTFTYWETPPGTVRAMRAWFFPDDYFGQEFRYPKNLRTISTASAPAPKLIPPAQAEAAPVPEPQANNQQEEVQQETVIIQPEVTQPEQPEPEQLAQNTTPAPPPAPEATPAPPAPSEPPAELPKTASPFPMFGLAGLIAAGLYSLVRAKQLS